MFTAQRYAQARSLLSSGVRLSVRPSVRLLRTLADYTAEGIVKLNSKGHFVSGGAKYMRVGNWRFSTEIAVYLGNGVK